MPRTEANEVVEEESIFCYQCDNLVLINEAFLAPGSRFSDMHYCLECFRSEFFECIECSDTFSYSVESYRAHICTFCSASIDEMEEEESEDENEVIYSYGYKPYPIFRRDKSERPLISEGKDISFYLGIEFELLCNGSLYETCRNDIRDTSLNDFVYCKHDSSVYGNDGDGVEIVSHPATFMWWTQPDNPIINFFENNHSWYANRTCGMHIHVSKSSFSSYQLAKLLRFIYKSMNQGFLLDISQREGRNSYCDFFPGIAKHAPFHALTSDTKERPRLKSMAHAKFRNINTGNEYLGSPRGALVNIGNQSTLEFRLFQGSPNVNVILKNIEFCHALFIFCRDYPPNKMSWAYFKDFVKEYRYMYRYLYRYMFRKESSDFDWTSAAVRIRSKS